MVLNPCTLMLGPAEASSSRISVRPVAPIGKSAIPGGGVTTRKKSSVPSDTLSPSSGTWTNAVFWPA